MKRLILSFFALLCYFGLQAQTLKEPVAKTIEYNLKNGLHVIIYQDNTSPIVNVGAMYHVGSKNERADRTGFAHLFEHLLFKGTKNIPEGEMENYMRAAGGYSNASTTADRTYYYTILPSNQLRLGLWIESERMLHPIISEKAINTEKEVVKEESRQRYDSNPFGRVPAKMQAVEYKEYPYRWPVIGSMDHLDAASVEDFKDFFKTYYVPNNACLVITGDVDINETKKYIDAYFNRIPKGVPVNRPEYNEKFNGDEIVFDSIPGINNSHVVISYQTVPETHKDAEVLSFINSYLSFSSDGLLNDVKEENPGLTKISCSTEMYENAGSFWFRASYKDSVDYKYVVSIVENTLSDLGKNGLSDARISQIKYSYESGYVDMFFDMPFLAEMLAISHLEWGTSKRVNQIIPTFKSITNEDLKRVVKKYFAPANRKILVINPKKK